MLCVRLRYTDFDYPFCIFKLFWLRHCTYTDSEDAPDWVAWLYDITTYLRTQRIENAVEGDIWKGTEKVLNQGILVANIFTSKALYGRHYDFVNGYEISVSQMATDMPRLSLSQFGSVLIHDLSRVCNKSNTRSATYGTGTAYLSLFVLLSFFFLSLYMHCLALRDLRF